MNRPLIALAGLVLAGGVAGGTFVVASGGGEEEVVQQVETATPAPELSATPHLEAAPAPVPTVPVDATLWRWVNVTLLVPSDGRFYVVQDSDPPEARPPKGGPVLFLAKNSSDGPGYMPSSYLSIDAETGAILRQEVRVEDRPEIQAIMATLTVSPLDVSTAKWPYSSELPADHSRESVGGMSFIRPLADTGLVVSSQLNDPGGPAIGILNGRSGVGVYVDAATGELIVNTEYLLPEYEAVFMRWVESVKLCGVEVSC